MESQKSPFRKEFRVHDEKFRSGLLDVRIQGNNPIYYNQKGPY